MRAAGGRPGEGAPTAEPGGPSASDAGGEDGRGEEGRQRPAGAGTAGRAGRAKAPRLRALVGLLCVTGGLCGTEL
eukprot:4587685-Prymnesium_polylepis.1